MERAKHLLALLALNHHLEKVLVDLSSSQHTRSQRTRTQARPSRRVRSLPSRCLVAHELHFCLLAPERRRSRRQSEPCLPDLVQSRRLSRIPKRHAQAEEEKAQQRIQYCTVLYLQYRASLYAATSEAQPPACLQSVHHHHFSSATAESR